MKWAQKCVIWNVQQKCVSDSWWGLLAASAKKEAVFGFQTDPSCLIPDSHRWTQNGCSWHYDLRKFFLESLQGSQCCVLSNALPLSLQQMRGAYSAPLKSSKRNPRVTATASLLVGGRDKAESRRVAWGITATRCGPCSGLESSISSPGGILGQWLVTRIWASWELCKGFTALHVYCMLSPVWIIDFSR